MEKILLLKPTSFNEQQKAFNILLKEINGKEKIGAIIIDSITMLYRLELAEAAKSSNKAKIRDINSKLANQLRILAELHARNIFQ